MCSYEERIRAVKLYIELDKRVAATIHQLGYRRRMISRAGIESTSDVSTSGI